MNSYMYVLNRICEKVQQNMASKQKDTDSIEWDVNVEILLFYAMIGHKPVGVNRNFMMLCIHQKFSAFLNRQISSKVIWDHLDSMYDMAALHDSEDLPFPKDEVDFKLPEEYDELIASKYGVKPQPLKDEKEIKSNSEIKVPKNAHKLKQNNVLVSNKMGKNHIKNETKTSNVENYPKVKLDSSLPKVHKVKPSLSPFPAKSNKGESISVSIDEMDTNSKSVRPERGSSPANTRKSLKTETNNTAVSSKKSVKQEQNSMIVKQKLETPENNAKKIKNEKEVLNKKGKTPSSNDNIKKSVKVESNTSYKKKNEAESPVKKNDLAVSKQKSLMKNSSSTNKGLRIDEANTPVISGSRKSSSASKTNVNDSAKKGKRPRSDESSKKGTPAKRRRI